VWFQSARGLVGEQELGVGRERARHLEPALVAVREVPRELVVAAAQAAEAQPLAGALVRVALLALDGRQAEDGAEDAALQARVHPDEDVLDRRHLLEEAD